MRGYMIGGLAGGIFALCLAATPAAAQTSSPEADAAFNDVVTILTGHVTTSRKEDDSAYADNARLTTVKRSGCEVGYDNWNFGNRVVSMNVEGSTLILHRDGLVHPSKVFLDSPAQAKQALDAIENFTDLCRNGGALVSREKSITYVFQDVPSGRAKQGYRNASVKLRYRFLLCADEIQIAYSYDRKSLDYNPEFYDYSRPGPHNVGTVATTAPPDVPDSIAIALHIAHWPDPSVIATIKDAIAGEALGMGCFTGQTQRVGMLAKLLGPKPTRADIKKYLSELSAAPAFNSLSILDVPLRNSHAVLPDDALLDAASARAARARADAAENASTAKLNADNAAQAAAQGRKYVADKDAAAKAQAEYEKQKAAKAKYDADMVAYRERVARDQAEAERKKAAFDARMATYKACVAGDSGACKRYQAGQ